MDRDFGFMKDFRGPSALDLLADFRKKFVALAERRTTELKALIDAHYHEAPTPEMRDAFDEYDSLRYFENELNRLLGAFAEEARQPFIELLCRIEPWNTQVITRQSITESLEKSERLRAPQGKV